MASNLASAMRVQNAAPKNRPYRLHDKPQTASLGKLSAHPLAETREKATTLMLEKVRRRLDAILDYAVDHGAIRGNPLPAVRRGKKEKRRHFPAVVDLPGVGTILRAARACDPRKGVQRMVPAPCTSARRHARQRG